MVDFSCLELTIEKTATLQHCLNFQSGFLIQYWLKKSACQVVDSLMFSNSIKESFSKVDITDFKILIGLISKLNKTLSRHGQALTYIELTTLSKHSLHFPLKHLTQQEVWPVELSSPLDDLDLELTIVYCLHFRSNLVRGLIMIWFLSSFVSLSLLTFSEDFTKESIILIIKVIYNS